MSYIFILLGVVAGSMVAAQGPVNGRLASIIGGPVSAGLVSLSVGWVLLVAIGLATRQPLTSIGRIVDQPWWLWMGGVFGAVMVVSAATAVPRIGASAWVAAVLAGQLVAALTYDHFGAFGQTVRPVTVEKLMGVGLLAAGVFLIRR